MLRKDQQSADQRVRMRERSMGSDQLSPFASCVRKCGLSYSFIYAAVMRDPRTELLDDSSDVVVDKSRTS